jgi:lysophospholipase L1-like esterase
VKIASARAGTALLLLVSLLVCAIAGEGIARFQSTRGVSQRGSETKHHFNIFRADDVLSFALRPNWSGIQEKFDFSVHVHTNAAGFRAAEGEPAPGAHGDAQRILVVGDSFAFGWGVEDDQTFAAVLARGLARDHRVEVINAGVPGYSTDQYWLFLRERGFALAPDLVLLVECGNDVEELASNRIELDADRLPVRVSSLTRTITARGKMSFDNKTLVSIPTFRFPGDGWLIDHSHFYNLLRFQTMRLWITAVQGRAQEQRARGDLPPADAPIASLSPAEIERGLAGSADFRLAYHAYLLAAIEREASARGIALRRLLVEGNPEPIRATCDPAHCLDQTALFTRDEKEMYFPIDRHWTAAGHRIVGEALAAWLGPALEQIR